VKKIEPIRIRTGEIRDQAVIAAFNIAMAKETEDKVLPEATITAGIKAVMDDPGKGFYLVAENPDKIAGSLMITPEWSDWRNGYFWWIQSVYVRPEFRRMGIYRKLYEHVKQLAAGKKICGFRLYVEKENETAQKTYESLGMDRTCYVMYEEGV